MDEPWLTVLLITIGALTLTNGVVLTVFALAAHRDRRVASFKEVLAGEVEYWQMREELYDSTFSLRRNLKVPFMPRQRWRCLHRLRGWWNALAPVPPGRDVVHCRSALVWPKRNQTLHVQLSWEDVKSRLDVVNRVARDYKVENLSPDPEHFVDDPRQHLVVLFGDVVLIVEPTVRRHHWQMPGDKTRAASASDPQ